MSSAARPPLPHRLWLFVALILALSVAVVVVGIVLLPSPEQSRSPGRSSRRAASATQRRRVVVTLTVHVLPTTLGTSGPGPSYPPRVSARVPKAWKGKLAAYGVAGVVLLAPAGWREGRALIAADGSRAATLRAGRAATVPGRLDYENSGGGSANTWKDAAPYFPWVRAQWARSHLAGPPPARRPGLVERFVGDHLVWYTVRASAAGQHRRVDGVTRTSLPGTASGTRTYSFDRLEVTLPSSDHALAVAILDHYLTSRL